MSNKRIVAGVLAALAFSLISNAQEIKIAGHEVQIHGFGTQGFVHTDGNNWLTMNTNGVGSGAFTDVGLNVGMQLRDNLRIGAQVYDRKLGALGDWHPQLDWALIDYRVKPWLGFKGGKVKTVLGIYNDTQDMDFANTYALLPQSVYPIDLRDSTIAHLGGDIYGKIRLKNNLGTLAYTVYGGHRSDSMHSAYPYLLASFSNIMKSFEGPVWGSDLRWKTPLQGLTVGASRLDQHITGTGTHNGSLNWEETKKDYTNQFYGQYTANRWHAESEYRRYFRGQIIANGAGENVNDIRGWYVAGGFRVNKWFEAGSYYSHYHDNASGLGPDYASMPDQEKRDYDKVVTGKFTINQYVTVKMEGHFMDGYANMPYPNGFYSQQNANGFKDNTNALVIRTGFSF